MRTAAEKLKQEQGFSRRMYENTFKRKFAVIGLICRRPEGMRLKSPITLLNRLDVYSYIFAGLPRAVRFYRAPCA